MRDPEKLKEEMDERKRKILDVAFELFVDKKIEAVSMGLDADSRMHRKNRKVIKNHTKCGKKPQKSANSSQNCSFLEVGKQI